MRLENRHHAEPHERERIPDLYEIVFHKEDGTVKFTGMRFASRFLPQYRDFIKEKVGFSIEPVTFKNKEK